MFCLSGFKISQGINFFDWFKTLLEKGIPNFLLLLIEELL
jgi:hypothetical protein